MDYLSLFLYVIATTLRIAVGFYQMALFIRALLSFFDPEEEGFFARLLALITEPIIAPVRALMNRFGWGADLPIDLSFLVTVVLLSGLSLILPTITL